MTDWFYEDDLCWIAECEACWVPMVVWKRTRPEPPGRGSGRVTRSVELDCH